MPSYQPRHYVKDDPGSIPDFGYIRRNEDVEIVTMLRLGAVRCLDAYYKYCRDHVYVGLDVYENVLVSGKAEMIKFYIQHMLMITYAKRETLNSLVEKILLTEVEERHWKVIVDVCLEVCPSIVRSKGFLNRIIQVDCSPEYVDYLNIRGFCY